MWFKRRKKSEQDHALSESLRSLQSLLSESGRTEPNLEPGDAPPDGDRPAAAGSDPRQPVMYSSHDAGPGDNEPPDRPAGSDSSSRWQDLSLSFDAEPAAPKARREPEADEHDRTGVEADADENAPEPDVLDAPAHEADGEPAPGPVSSDPSHPEGRAKAPAATDRDDPETSGDPHVDHPELGLEESVVFYDELPEPALTSGHEAVEDDDARGPEANEPDLELDLTGNAGDARGEDNSGGPEESAAAATPARSDDTGAGSLGESAVADIEKLETSGIAGARSLEESDVADADPPAHAGSPERPGAGDAQSLDDSRPAEPAHGETGADETLSLDERDDEGIDLENIDFGDVDAGAPAPAETYDRAAAEKDDGPQVPALRESDPDSEKPEDQLDLELDSGEPGYADIPTLTEAVYVPDEPPDAAGGEPAGSTEEPAAPAPGAGESPHEEGVEQCLGNLRVRLRLMGVDALSPEQEKELRDTLVEFLEDFQQD